MFFTQRDTEKEREREREREREIVTEREREVRAGECHRGGNISIRAEFFHVNVVLSLKCTHTQDTQNDVSNLGSYQKLQSSCNSQEFFTIKA